MSDAERAWRRARVITNQLFDTHVQGHPFDACADCSKYQKCHSGSFGLKPGLVPEIEDPPLGLSPCSNMKAPGSYATANLGALTSRARSRLAGPSGNHWFAAHLDAALPPGQCTEVVWWKTSICLFKSTNKGAPKDNTDDGHAVFAVENRCAHRHLRLSKGHVEGDCITCCYHGWSYNGEGHLVKIGHEVPATFKTATCGHCDNNDNQPLSADVRLRSYPVRKKYGFVWIFPGDPALAQNTPLPVIPWLELSDNTGENVPKQQTPVPWRPLAITIRTHWANIIENNCDFYHAHLHRDYKPFWQPTLQSVTQHEDNIRVHYHTDMQSGWLSKKFGAAAEHSKDGNIITLEIEYPYICSNLDDKYLSVCFLLPINEETTRVFYVFLWGPIHIGPFNVPHSIRQPFLWFAHRLYLIPLLKQDVYALEEEQERHNVHWNKAGIEVNPFVQKVHRLVIDKWEDYLQTEKARMVRDGPYMWRVSKGAGLEGFDWANDS